MAQSNGLVGEGDFSLYYSNMSFYDDLSIERHESVDFRDIAVCEFVLLFERVSESKNITEDDARYQFVVFCVDNGLFKGKYDW